MPHKPSFIAEVDDAGDVLWVWVAEAPKFQPRPVRDAAAERLRLSGASCHGASPEAIDAWFALRSPVSVPASQA